MRKVDVFEMNESSLSNINKIGSKCDLDTTRGDAGKVQKRMN